MRNLLNCFLSAIRTTTTVQSRPTSAAKITMTKPIDSMDTPVMPATKPNIAPTKAIDNAAPAAPRQTISHQTINVRCQVGSSSCMAFPPFAFGNRLL